LTDEVKVVSYDEDKPSVFLKNGEEVTADVIIAADGKEIQFS